ncbi:hypothetical protein CDV31_011154 [Fusarium ambrosium]|uniref:Heterokaryon incompatibility domain-containing protein n=1 Tax=Fusarium ambrosium TaxID=131363 RepID=A0A428TIL1_9HYPO|nr:hypothetical protein CDV31_011154 [Fusarium ambrosium]
MASDQGNRGMYTPLDQALDQIRILNLLPGTFDDPIRCQLSIETPDAEFDALSYVWGDAHDTRPIEVQGQLLKATKNLESALRHIRSQHQPHRLWVDAVCINQEDDSERGHQVKMMAAIYQGAKRVIVWLGPNTGNDSIIQMILKFGANPDLHWDPIKHPNVENQEKNSALSLGNWLRNEWYTRIWTLQEAVLARSLLYRSGSFTIQEHEMGGFIKSFLRHFIHERCCDIDNLGGYIFWKFEIQVSNLTSKIGYMMALKRRKGPLNFLQIASKFRYRLATNPRDKVFGILGLTEDLPKSIVDYTSSVSETFSQVVIEHITQTGNLDILSHTLPKANNSAASNNGNFPSWVPDWGDDRPEEDWRLSSLSERQLFTHLFRACSPSLAPFPRRHPQGGLELQGLFCDEIVELGPPTEFMGLVLGVEQLRSWRQLANVDKDPERPYIGGSTMLDAYFRTLCMDIDPLKVSPDDPPTEASTVKADHNTRGLHDEWWWETSLRKQKDAQGPPKVHTRHSLIFRSHIALMVSGRRLFFSKKGYLGLAPDEAQKGDQIWILNGGRLPLVLRRLEAHVQGFLASRYILIGDSYVHGVMHGEFVGQAMKNGAVMDSVILA